jgi:uracil-DNA glycosylase family 4
MSPKPRRSERGLVMPPGQRSIPRSRPTRPKPQRAPEAPEVPSLVAKAAGDLVSIAASIRLCSLCVGSEKRYALGAGYPRAPVMLVGERPTEADLETGTVFTDEADALDKAFVALGMSLSWVYGTTVFRTKDGVGCADHLLAEIEAVEPRVIVAFGPRAVDGIRALEGRCGLHVPDEVPQGSPVGLRPGLVLIASEPLPEGVTQKDAKRRLWRDLQQVPALLQLPTHPGETG